MAVIFYVLMLMLINFQSLAMKRDSEDQLPEDYQLLVSDNKKHKAEHIAITVQLFELVKQPNCSLEAVLELISAGADIYFSDTNGQTALHHASKKGHTEICWALIKKGASVNARENDGWTPLHWAAYRNDRKMILVLIENGADVNSRDNDRWTPLHWASQEGHKESVSVLLQKDADANACGADGWTSLHAAAQEGYQDVCLELIGKKADLNARHNDGWTPLILATKRGHTALCLTLFEKGADLNACDARGWTSLHFAAEKNFRELCLALIGKGAKINAPAKRGESALLIAVLKNHRAVCLTLIENGADLNARTERGNTVLHRAAQKGLTQLCEMLIRYGADVNAKNNLGRTPLYGAICNNHLETSQNLIKHAFYLEPPIATVNQAKVETVFEKACSAVSSLFRLIGGSPQANTPFKRVITTLCCLKKLNLPRNLAQMILLRNRDLTEDVFQIIRPALKRPVVQDGSVLVVKNKFPALFNELIVDRIYRMTFNELEKILQLIDKQLLNRGCIAQLSPEKVERDFGEDIKHTIRVHLNLYETPNKLKEQQMLTGSG